LKVETTFKTVHFVHMPFLSSHSDYKTRTRTKNWPF